MIRVPPAGKSSNRQAASAQAAVPDHFCPGCGIALKHFARYPWYFCGACLASAEDGEGRKLAFGNASLSGGLTWAYDDDRLAADDTAWNVICLIKGRLVTVGEARFGGVVAEPVNSASGHLRRNDGKTVVLTSGPDLANTRRRLKLSVKDPS